MHFISKNNFFRLLDELEAAYQVYVPVKKGNQQFYKRYAGCNDDIVIGEVRAFEPLKAFFLPARERVARGFSPEIPHSEDKTFPLEGMGRSIPADKPIAIIGAKACDLKGFTVGDHVFQDHDYKDPFYIKAREQNLIISADCTWAMDTCFCLALEVRPYPEKNFDINLSTVSNGFVLEAGSPKGKALVDKNPALFETAESSLLAERDEQRNWVVKKIEKNIKENSLPYQDEYQGIIEKGFDSPVWQDKAATCVECGACNVICPTCHCFLLYDQKNKENMARLRIWDSCMIKDFARVAGGANPRPKLWMRLRNRFEKKFDFFPKTRDTYACTGCGRCILACPAKIDIREVLKRLVADAR